MNESHSAATASPVNNWILGEAILSIHYDTKADCLYALSKTSLYRKGKNDQDFLKVHVIADPSSGSPRRECYSFCSDGNTVFVTLIGVDVPIINAAWIGDVTAPASGRIETRFSGLMTMFAQSEHNACFDEHGTLYVASPRTVLYSTDLGKTYRPHAYIDQELAKALAFYPTLELQNIKVNYPGHTAAFLGTTIGVLCCYEGDSTFDTIAYSNPAVTSTVNYAYDIAGDRLVTWLYFVPQDPQRLYTVNMQMFRAENDDPEFLLGSGPVVDVPKYAVDPRSTSIAVSSTLSHTGPNFYLALQPVSLSAATGDSPSNSALKQVLFFSKSTPVEEDSQWGAGFPATLSPLPVSCMYQYAAQLYIGTDAGILQYRESDIIPPAST